jgi:tetratricopeptide (TPR) repeat protein
LYQQSLLSMKLGKLADADAGLKKVLHLNPDSAQAHLALADVHQARGLVMNQRQELNEVLRLQPTMLQARLALAKNLNTHNEAKSALQLLDRTPESQKQTVGFVIERNWALLGTGNTKEVRSTLDQALRVTRFPELVLQDSVLRMSEKDFAGSRASAEEILSRYPQEPRAARLLVNSYAAQGPSNKLIDRLLEAEARYPASAPLRELIGQWYIRNGKPTEARRVLESARAADPKFLPAELDLAELDHKENHAGAARQRLAGIVAANPTNVSALLLLASIEADSGDKPASIATYRSVLDLEASNLAALKSLAYQLAVQNPDEALKFAQQAVEAAPEDPTVQDTLGWVYYRKGIYDSAITYLKAALSKDPTPGRRFHLAMSYLKSGDRATGQQMLLIALKDDPDLAKKEPGW